MLIWVLGQTRSAISSIISQYLGAGKLDEVKNLPAQAIFIITSISLLIIIVTYPLAQHIFELYNASGIILDYATSYYKIRVFGFPFTLFTIAVFGAFRGLQNTYYPMIVYGIQDFIPAMHIKGAAYASVIAQFLMAILSAYYIIKKTDFPLIVSFPFNKEIVRFLTMIANLVVRTLALNVTLYFATRYATGYGDEYIAAYTIAINLWFLGAFIVDGYASAGNILSGKLLGGKEYDKLITLSNSLIKIGALLGLIIGVLGALFYYPIGAIFTKETKVLAFIFDGMFKGLGKMKVLRNLLLVSTLFVFLPILFLLDKNELKLTGIFIAFTFWILARGVPLIIKFRKEFLPLSQNH